MKYNPKHRTARRRKSTAIIMVVLFIIVLGSVYYFFIAPRMNNAAESNDIINLDPPTDAELRETEQYKDNLANKTEDNSKTVDESSEGLQSVTPIIGYLQVAENGDIESNGYISGIVETDGTCTLTLEKDGVRITESRQAMIDAQSTICGHMVISRGKLSEGSWKAYITYVSSARKGSSEERKIEVK